MGPVKYQEVNVTLSAATFSRLQQRNPFNKRRVADEAIEAIRVALFTMYPPRTPEEWKDRSRYHGTGRYMILVSYDLVCYSLRKWTNMDADPESFAKHLSEQPVQIMLEIPIGLMRWIEQIARSKQISMPEATVYAIEYGLQVLDSQVGGAEGAGEGLRKVWSHILRAIRNRFVNVGRI